jgi:hypothetical protein
LKPIKVTVEFFPEAYVVTEAQKSGLIALLETVYEGVRCGTKVAQFPPLNTGADIQNE